MFVEDFLVSGCVAGAISLALFLRVGSFEQLLRDLKSFITLSKLNCNKMFNDYFIKHTIKRNFSDMA